MRRSPTRSGRLRAVLIAMVIVPALSVALAPAAAASPSAIGDPASPAHLLGAPSPTPPKRPDVTRGPSLPKLLPAPVVLDRLRSLLPTPRRGQPWFPFPIPLPTFPWPSPPTTPAPPVSSPANQVGVRALVIALDNNDYGLSTWTSMLDRTGAAYDVLLAKTTDITASTFLRADGSGKYNAILLTDAMLLSQDAAGNYASAFTTDEWNTLWAYERDFSVRQATLYASYGTFPEDYCLRAGSEGSVADAPLSAGLTATGASVFSDLKPTIQIPIVQSYVYSDTLAPGCDAQPIVTAGSAVLGVKSTSTDGRERVALTFTSNQYLMHAHLLTYGLFRWASKGIYLGEQRHYLNVDVDDWFNDADEQLPGGAMTTWTMTAHDAYNARTQERALGNRYPLSSAFRFGLAFNGSDANLRAGFACSPNGTAAQLTATSRCISNDVRWINHTYTHAQMNSIDYATAKSEITNNLQVANFLWLPVNASVLKTGEYSGLGTYNPNGNDDTAPPTDFGLAAANPNLLQAAYDTGIRYLHGNMSFTSQRPACFNCATPFPKPTDNPPGPNVPENVRAALSIVPDWPTNIAYFSTNPDEETYFYNQYYGPGGRFPAFSTNQTYAQVMANESDQAMQHIATGSLYTHTVHIANLRDYGSGNTLVTDWLDQTLAKYSALYSVPLLSPDGLTTDNYAVGRNAHFAQLKAGVDAVYDRVAGTVTVTSPLAGQVTMSGARTPGYQTYGSEYSAALTLTPGTPVTFTPALRP